MNSNPENPMKSRENWGVDATVESKNILCFFLSLLFCSQIHLWYASLEQFGEDPSSHSYKPF